MRPNHSWERISGERVGRDSARMVRRLSGRCSVKHASVHLPRRTSGSPQGASDDGPGQASLRASVTPGSQHPEIPVPWRGVTDTPASRARWPSPGVPAFFCPAGAPGDSRGFPTEGGTPRRLGTCPGLSSLAPLGLEAPNQTRQPTPGIAPRFRSDASGPASSKESRGPVS